MFGKRPTDGDGKRRPPEAPPPAAEGPAIATRPQRIEPGAVPAPPPSAAMPSPQPAPAAKTGQPVAGPKSTAAFEQLRAAQGPTQVVREQSDYYHATKTTIFNALINTIDLAALAQLDTKQAGEEIKDIVAEL